MNRSRDALEPTGEALATCFDTHYAWNYADLRGGLQILVEGLAMAAFANLHQIAVEPLLKQLIHYVMRDEARHVAFGVLSLRGHYDGMAESELRCREDFVVEACLLMRDRLVGEEVADAMGFDREEVRRRILDSPILQMFRQALFARVVPNVKRRARFAELGHVWEGDFLAYSARLRLAARAALPRRACEAAFPERRPR